VIDLIDSLIDMTHV